LVTMGSGLGLRLLAEQAAKAVPFGGDLVAGLIAAAATWSIGEVALEYYEGGKKLSAGTVRQRTTDLYHRFRKDNTVEGLRKEAANGTTPTLLDEPKENIVTK